MPDLSRRPPTARPLIWTRRVGALAAVLWAAACTGGSGGTQILQSGSASVPTTVAVTGSTGGAGPSGTGQHGGHRSAVTGSTGSAPSPTGVPSVASSPPSSESGPPVTPSASAVGSGTPSTGVCHDPDNPDVIYDCDTPPTPTFPGDHAHYVTSLTDCMAGKGWPHVTLAHGSIAPASGRPASEAFGKAALGCLHQVGTYDIANASDAEITHDYRQLRDQWTCLKQQGLPVQPFPPLQDVLGEFHRTHEFALDPLDGLDRDVGLSYCPAPDVPGRTAPPPTGRLGH